MFNVEKIRPAVFNRIHITSMSTYMQFMFHMVIIRGVSDDEHLMHCRL